MEIREIIDLIIVGLVIFVGSGIAIHMARDPQKSKEKSRKE